jgi:hypothetical protein
MKISDQLKLIQSSLVDWQRANKASIEIARDIVHVFGLLTTSPGACRVAIVFREEVKRGEYEETGMVDRKYWLVISQGRSLKLNPADQLTEGHAGGKPLYDLGEELREELRAFEFDQDTTEVTPDYKGTYPFEADGWLIAANYLEFTIGTQLPAVA